MELIAQLMKQHGLTVTQAIEAAGKVQGQRAMQKPQTMEQQQARVGSYWAEADAGPMKKPTTVEEQQANVGAFWRSSDAQEEARLKAETEAHLKAQAAWRR